MASSILKAAATPRSSALTPKASRKFIGTTRRSAPSWKMWSWTAPAAAWIWTTRHSPKTRAPAIPLPISPMPIRAGLGGHPKNVMFLTADAFGVLPPISKLTKAQAMYHFLSGYTAKVAGTERGVTEPRPEFSACFGAPFMPLHPSVYAEMLGERSTNMAQMSGWSIPVGLAGRAGVGKRMKLAYTRQNGSRRVERRIGWR